MSMKELVQMALEYSLSMLKVVWTMLLTCLITMGRSSFVGNEEDKRDEEIIFGSDNFDNLPHSSLDHFVNMGEEESIGGKLWKRKEAKRRWQKVVTRLEMDLSLARKRMMDF